VSRKPMADALGEVYEQFLGKVIRLTAGHQAKVGERSKSLVPTRALDGPSAPRKLSAMQSEPRPALTETDNMGSVHPRWWLLSAASNTPRDGCTLLDVNRAAVGGP
jgi:hypothetical protein